MTDVVTAFLFTILGYGAKHLGYNRAALILGFVLGNLAETYFLISLSSYGIGFPLRPICIILMIITVLGLSSDLLVKLWQRRQG